jgi:hypothetical protein
MSIKRGEVFNFLPRANPVGSDQQQERFGLGDFLGELGQPEACTQRDRGNEDLGLRLNPGRAARTASARGVSLELNERNIRTF